MRVDNFLLKIGGRKLERNKETAALVFVVVLVFCASASILWAEEASGEKAEASTPQTRIARHILSLPFREDVVYEVRVGYGVTVELELPEEVRDIVSGDERLVACDYLGRKAYLKGTAYAAGESTNVHLNLVSGHTLHLAVKITEPASSDFAFKFTAPTKSVFSQSYVKREMAEERRKLEGEMEKREADLEKVTDTLAEEKLKTKLLKEEKLEKKISARTRDLEIKGLEVSRIGQKVYVKFTLRNLSKHDFPISSVTLSRALPDPKNPKKVLGYDDIALDGPTLESGIIPGGEAVKALLAFDLGELAGSDRVVLRVIEEGGLGRVVEFKKSNLFSR